MVSPAICDEFLFSNIFFVGSFADGQSALYLAAGLLTVTGNLQEASTRFAADAHGRSWPLTAATANECRGSFRG
jgi:hypothetical protein